jgi:uncharacterized protein YkwD
MKTIRAKTLILLGCIGSVCLAMFIACGMVDFFETVDIEDPSPRPPDPAAVAAIKTAFANITPPPQNPSDDDEVYSTPPDWLTDPTDPVVGVLDPEYEANGLDTLNIMRSLAGLAPVAINSGQQEQAQAGADVMAISKVFDHDQDYAIASANIWDVTGEVLDTAFHALGNTSTTSSNLFAAGNGTTLADSIRAYFDDSDTQNIDRLGHRRWCLNPEMGSTAFGRAVDDGGTSYMTMQSQNTGGTPAAGYVAWPSPANDGYFPAEAFGGSQAWSVSLPASAYDTSVTAADITVTLTNDAGGNWEFTDADTNPSGKYFNVETTGFGIPYCIIFRPDGSVPLAGKTYTVLIEGLKDTDGVTDKPIEYDIEFFSLSSP